MSDDETDVDLDDGDAETDGTDDGGCDPTTCDDGNACNGDEVCTVGGECVPTRPPADGTPCERPAGPGHVVPGHCFMELCRPDTCGNTVIDSGEDCDDGNLVNGDGCEGDCTFSCGFSDECDDGDPCNGVEACTGHRCQAGAAQPDGTPCGDDLVCVAATCVSGGCGDGVLDTTAGEECDDGNDVTGDGCNPDCTLSCRSEGDCSDLQLCNGTETCDTASNTCSMGTSAADGTPCVRTGGAPGTCRASTCAGLDCGNSAVDAGEECDDGNIVTGDGCEADCLWSCHQRRVLGPPHVRRTRDVRPDGTPLPGRHAAARRNGVQSRREPGDARDLPGRELQPVDLRRRSGRCRASRGMR